MKVIQKLLIAMTKYFKRKRNLRVFMKMDYVELFT